MVDSVLGTSISRKLLRLALHLCLCVIMADATELIGVGGGYVEQ